MEQLEPDNPSAVQLRRELVASVDDVKHPEAAAGGLPPGATTQPEGVSASSALVSLLDQLRSSSVEAVQGGAVGWDKRLDELQQRLRASMPGGEFDRMMQESGMHDLFKKVGGDAGVSASSSACSDKAASDEQNIFQELGSIAMDPRARDCSDAEGESSHSINDAPPRLATRAFHRVLCNVMPVSHLQSRHWQVSMLGQGRYQSCTTTISMGPSTFSPL